MVEILLFYELEPEPAKNGPAPQHCTGDTSVVGPNPNDLPDPDPALGFMV